MYNANYMEPLISAPGGVRTTADSQKEGRLMVSAGKPWYYNRGSSQKKRQALKKIIKSK